MKLNCIFGKDNISMLVSMLYLLIIPMFASVLALFLM